MRPPTPADVANRRAVLLLPNDVLYTPGAIEPYCKAHGLRRPSLLDVAAERRRRPLSRKDKRRRSREEAAQ